MAQQPKAGKQSLAVACKWNDAVIFYDAVTGQEQTKVAIGHRPHEMALAAGGGWRTCRCMEPTFTTTWPRGDERLRSWMWQVGRKWVRSTWGSIAGRMALRWGIARGCLYLTCDRPAALLVLDPKSKSVKRRLTWPTGRRCRTWWPCRRTSGPAYVANSGNGTVSVIDLEAKKETKTISIGGVPMGMALTADGQTLFATNRTANGVAVIDTAAGKVKRIIEISGQPVRAALTPDERLLLVTLIDSGELAVVDAREMTLVRAAAGWAARRRDID